VMLMMGVKQSVYHIVPSSQPYYFPGRQAQVFLGDNPIGSFGIVHPDALANFEIPNVVSLLEINLEPFL
jgi:phenylalanyl-tRNA synthetase beta chain